MNTYRINEIFASIQGEGWNTGESTVFVRFAGCNIRCPFCYTPHEEYKEMTASEITNKIAELSTGGESVTFTGGEPLLQLDDELLQRLRDRRVRIETNGMREPLFERGMKCGGETIYIVVSPKTNGYIKVWPSEVKYLVRGCDTLYTPGIARETMQNQFNGELPRYSYQPIIEEDGTIDQLSLNTAIDKVCRDTQAGIKCRLSLQLHRLIDVR